MGAALETLLRAAKFPTRNVKSSNRASKYPQNDGFYFTGVSFPTPLGEIPRVERQNNLAINFRVVEILEVIFSTPEYPGRGRWLFCETVACRMITKQLTPL